MHIGRTWGRFRCGGGKVHAPTLSSSRHRIRARRPGRDDRHGPRRDASRHNGIQEAVEVGDPDGTVGIREHLRALQEIADEPGANGTRATGTQGHEDSVAYVVSQLDTSYWNVTTQPFDADVFTELAPPVLVANPPAVPAWVVNQDFATMEFSGSGSVDRSAGGDHRLRRADRPGEHLERRLRGRRLPGRRDQPGGQGRGDPAGHLRLRAQGAQRPAARRRGRPDLQ